MALPGWLETYLDEDGAKRIEAAVGAAEKRTRGEIVPMVVRRSSSGGHVAWLLAAVMLVAAYASGWGLTRTLLPWGRGYSTWIWLPLDVCIAGMAGWLLSHLAWIRRRLTPKADRQKAAHRHAEVAFHRLGINRTQEHAGILLFVSIEDRQAVVLADKAIAHRLPRETWDEICEMLLRGARQKNLANGLQAAIARSAAVLEKPFPPKKKKTNQLSNALVIEG